MNRNGLLFSKLMSKKINNNVITVKNNKNYNSNIRSTFNEPSTRNVLFPTFLDQSKCCTIIGAPMHAGQRKLGVDKGPKQLREVGLLDNLKGLGWKINDYGDLEFPNLSDTDIFNNNNKEEEDEDENKLKFIPGTQPRNCKVVGNALEIIYNSTNHAHSRKNFVLTLGGDHSIGAATVLSVLNNRPNTGVIWVDAHGDINTPNTSSTGNLHGMPVAIAMNLFDRTSLPGFEWLKDKPILQPNQLVYIGLRDLDPGEKKLIHSLGIKAFTMFEIDKYGIGAVMKMAMEHLKLPNGEPRPIHLSYDIDAVDPDIAPSTGTLVRGGFTFREAHYIAESVGMSGQLGSMDLVEVNAALSPKTYDDSTKDFTVQFGANLVSSAMGSSIL